MVQIEQKITYSAEQLQSEGTLEAFQKVVVDVTCYSNMIGHFEDILMCQVNIWKVGVEVLDPRESFI
jgi:hypothetical protein